MLPIDGALLRAIAPPTNDPAIRQRQSDIIDALSPILQPTLQRYDIDTPLRIAHFLSLICHESDGFRTTVEYSDGAPFEGRTDLGNTERGDGALFKGRGLVMLTGRAKYREYAGCTGIDLVAEPERAADPVLALTISCEFWRRHNLNQAADADDLLRTSGGSLVGSEPRRRYLELAKSELARIEAAQADRH